MAEMFSSASAVFSNLENVFNRRLERRQYSAVGEVRLHRSGIFDRCKIICKRLRVLQGLVFGFEDCVARCCFCKNEDHGLCWDQ